jgi:hypothetical protein
MERGVYLRVGERHVLPHVELLGDRNETDQAVLEARLLGRCGGAGQPLEALVHLERVGADRHRVLSALAQEIRQLERDSGLAHPGRPEEGDDVRQRG